MFDIESLFADADPVRGSSLRVPTRPEATYLYQQISSSSAPRFSAQRGTQVRVIRGRGSRGHCGFGCGFSSSRVSGCTDKCRRGGARPSVQGGCRSTSKPPRSPPASTSTRHRGHEPHLTCLRER